MEWRLSRWKPAGNSVGLDAFDVVARPCVDLDLVPFIDEEGDIDRRSGLDLRGLLGSRCRISPDARGSLEHLQFNGDRNLKRDHFAPVEHNVHTLTLLEKTSPFTHCFFRNANLIVGLLIHEDK